MTTRQTESRSGVPLPTSGQCTRIRSDERWQNTRRRGRCGRRREVLYDVLDGDSVVGTTPHFPSSRQRRAHFEVSAIKDVAVKQLP